MTTLVARKRAPAKPKAEPKAPIQRPAITSGEPTVEVVRTKSNLATWVLVALAVGAFGFNVYKWQTAGGTAPQPQPKPASVQTLVTESRKSLLAEYGKAFEQAAKSVETGEIKTAKQVYESLGPATKRAREQAFAGIDQHMSTSMPRDVDTLKPEAAKFLLDIAEAFKKEAK